MQRTGIRNRTTHGRRVSAREAVEGMTCASCPYQVEAALKKVDGVMHIEVSLADKRAVVTFDDAKVDAAALTKATTVAGFPSHLQPDAITPAANQ